MSILDDIVGFAIGKAEDKLQGEETNEKETFLGGILRFIVTFIWFVVVFVVTFCACLVTVGADFAKILNLDESGPLYVIGIGTCILIALITFLIPYLRKKGTMTRWLGVCALGDAAWWTYLMITL